MSVLRPEIVAELNDSYTRFVESVRFREGEDFYRHDFPVLELSYNENPLGPGKLAQDVLRRHVEFAHRYPPLGYTILIDELARRLALGAENVVVTAGSVTAIYLAVSQWADPGDEVVFSKSSIPWYRWSTLANKSVPVPVPLKNDMGHDLGGLAARVNDRTKVVIISNPHNPTGQYLPEEELRAFHARLPENVLLIVDQAYYEYQTRQEDVLLRLVTQVPNLMLTRTFSKIHGLAGLRVGYGIANADVIKGIRAHWLAFMPAIASVSAYAAQHALLDEGHLKESIRFNKCVKEAMYRLTASAGLMCLESEANFVAVNIKDSRVNEELFHQNGLAFTPGYFFGYPEWARISFDRREDEMLAKLSRTFAQIQGGCIG
jgi:histidinol-phosphate aminotransferase